ncbi:MAG: protein phosphatase 2C domain-containing protein, partial [Geopsychrobacter sp.]|nr:protein phosphatase 2C domain-containing protein [Geopsychrobacter sp.]
MKLTACALTDIGLRRTNNEDCVFADCESGLFIVADGMGGHAAGEVASAMAVATICNQLPPVAPAPQDAATCLQHAFVDASHDIHQAARKDDSKRDMGTTLSVLYMDSEAAQLAHVGDSRIYRLRDDQLEQLSIDHSLVAEQVRLGIISAAEARNSQMRNILMQAVGLEEKVEVFLLRQPLSVGDLFLLCSDGLTDMLDDEQIHALLRRNLTVQQSTEQLIDAA